MKDNPKTKERTLTVLLMVSIIVIIIMGYFIYNFYNKKISEEKINYNYSYSNIQGLYKGVAKDEDGESRKFELYLSENGTYIYVNYVDNEAGTIGNYTINDGNVILNYLFNKGNDASLTATEGKKILKIGENNLMIDSEPENTNLSSLELKKEKIQDDLYDSINGVNELINNSELLNQYNT